MQKLWVPGNRKTTLCIDSYQDGILQGRFYGYQRSGQSFSSLIQFLVMMEDALEEASDLQSDTIRRSFSAMLVPDASADHRDSIRTGLLATFELQILFRQHTSWQGVILWQEQNRKLCFRSALELILLINSALREQKASEAG